MSQKRKNCQPKMLAFAASLTNPILSRCGHERTRPTTLVSTSLVFRKMFLQILYQTVTHPVWPTRKLHPKVLGGFGKPADVISPTGESREYPAARLPFRLDGKDLDKE